MAVVRWDPWKELAGIERQFDELFARSGRPGQQRLGWAPAVDVHHEGDTMVIEAEIPGVSPDDVEVTFDDDVLTISGHREEARSVNEGQWVRRERMTGQFRRSISLPPGVDPNQISAKASNGVIELHIPRPRKTAPHRVQLEGGGGGQQAKPIDVTSSDSSRAAGSSGAGKQSSSEGSSADKRATSSRASGSSRSTKKGSGSASSKRSTS